VEKKKGIEEKLKELEHKKNEINVIISKYSQID